jgi:hypothetical protein
MAIITILWKGDADSLAIKPSGDFFTFTYRTPGATLKEFHAGITGISSWAQNVIVPGAEVEFLYTFESTALATAALPKFDDINASNAISKVPEFTKFMADNHITRTVKLI